MEIAAREGNNRLLVCLRGCDIVITHPPMTRLRPGLGFVLVCLHCIALHCKKKNKKKMQKLIDNVLVPIAQTIFQAHPSTGPNISGPDSTVVGLVRIARLPLA